MAWARKHGDGWVTTSTRAVTLPDEVDVQTACETAARTEGFSARVGETGIELEKRTPRTISVYTIVGENGHAQIRSTSTATEMHRNSILVGGGGLGILLYLACLLFAPLSHWYLAFFMYGTARLAIRAAEEEFARRTRAEALRVADAIAAARPELGSYRVAARIRIEAPPPEKDEIDEVEEKRPGASSRL